MKDSLYLNDSIVNRDGSSRLCILGISCVGHIEYLPSHNHRRIQLAQRIDDSGKLERLIATKMDDSSFQTWEGQVVAIDSGQHSH
jgi:hypothetical protein